MTADEYARILPRLQQLLRSRDGLKLHAICCSLHAGGRMDEATAEITNWDITRNMVKRGTLDPDGNTVWLGPGLGFSLPALGPQPREDSLRDRMFFENIDPCGPSAAKLQLTGETMRMLKGMT